MEDREIITQISPRLTWNYDVTLPRVADLYERGKAGQWSAANDVDWSVEVNYGAPLAALPAGGLPFPRPEEHRIPKAIWDEFRWQHHAWVVSQFLHAEQAALLAAARLVEVAPDMDSKYFASTQVGDEGRHVEVFSRYLREKLGRYHDVEPHLKAVLEYILTESKWDVVFLGMQIIAEGYALASFRLNTPMFPEPLIKQITARITRDEARHVSFGLLALDGLVKEFTAAELREREDFIRETLSLLCRIPGIEETWHAFGYGSDLTAKDAVALARRAEYRRILFARVMPSLARLGYLTPRVREHCRTLDLEAR